MSFGEKLRFIREQRKMTQSEIAALVPMKQSNYSKIECGHQEPNLTQLRQLCKILEVSSDYLLEIDDLKTSSDRKKNEEALFEGIRKIIKGYTN